MAEGLLRHLTSGRVEAFSAGTEATHVRPLAIKAMAELGIDISSHESKTLDQFVTEPFDAVITVCDDANETCPVFPGAARRLHWGLPDPSQATGSEADQLAVYRTVRDAIRRRVVEQLLPSLDLPSARANADRVHSRAEDEEARADHHGQAKRV